LNKLIYIIILYLCSIGCNNNNNNIISHQETESVELSRSFPDSADYEIVIDKLNNKIDVILNNDINMTYFVIMLENKHTIDINEITFNPIFDDSLWTTDIYDIQYNDYISIFIICDCYVGEYGVEPYFNDVLFSIDFNWIENTTIYNPNFIFTEVFIWDGEDDYGYNDFLNYIINKNDYER